jgi:DNA-directed RNA polymerase sigma subunit (sigma70/sigma32)
VEEIKKIDKFSRIKTKIIHNAIGADLKSTSFDSPLGDEIGSGTLIDIMDSGEYYSDLETETNQGNSILLKLTESLNSYETEIVLRRHGVSPFDNTEGSFTQIAYDMGTGLTSECIRIRYKSAIKKMAKYAKQLNYKMSDIL